MVLKKINKFFEEDLMLIIILANNNALVWALEIIFFHKA